ncbi:glyoxalase/bleomycin resistance/extradiol dioxygenase family protein [Emticicia sp. SJ17W-69]|uniref:glyoxalase/bleomycin resistance/extradiol dioxygenase family protein n=1 Tax=Emticicia sp. SJ17W-69 TaxID=3421657 RepID=UPI003EBFB9C3
MKQIFINLPVENVEKSMDFYTQLGFSNKTLFSDEHQKCMVWSEQIYVMLIAQEKFKTYSRKPILGKKNKIDAYFTLPVESLDVVNEIVDNGLKAGGTEPIPMIDEGFMQIRKIEDFDGHTWDIIYMDLSKFRQE